MQILTHIFAGKQRRRVINGILIGCEPGMKIAELWSIGALVIPVEVHGQYFLRRHNSEIARRYT